MYYHASSVKNIEILIPHISNHDIPLIYFSEKRENVLVYLSNAIEKFCRENGFEHSGKWTKWASYGFDKDGKLRIEEYYPNAIYDTYSGISGYIYGAENIVDPGYMTDIPYAVTSSGAVPVISCEYIPDAFRAILEAAEMGLISVRKYEDNSPQKLKWIEKTMLEEYKKAAPDYRYFLENKFPFIS